MQLRLIFLTLLFFTVTIGSVFAQLSDKKNVEVISAIYNFKFNHADSLIQTIDIAANSAIYNVLSAHYMRWKYIPIHEQPELVVLTYNTYLEQLLADENALEIFKVNAHILKAEQQYNQGDYYKALSSGADAYKLVKNKLETPTEELTIPWLLVVSLYNYYYAYYQSNNSLMGGFMWLFKEGDKQKGLEGLKAVASTSGTEQTEALTYLSHFYLRLENRADLALQYAGKLYRKHPENLKFYELFIEASLATKSVDVNLKILADKMLQAKTSYFQKYGLVYSTLLKDSISSNDILFAKNQLEKQGGGNHLKSLLLAKDYQLQGSIQEKKMIEDELKSIRTYNYTLTQIKR